MLKKEETSLPLAPVTLLGINPETVRCCFVFTTISLFQIYTSRVPAQETCPFDIHKPFAYTVVG